MEPISAELTCQELVELVTEYFEGAMSPTEKARFEKHLEKCDWCKIYLDQMRLTIRTLGKLTEDSVPPQAKEDLLQVFRDWKRAQGTQ